MTNKRPTPETYSPITRAYTSALRVSIAKAITDGTGEQLEASLRVLIQSGLIWGGGATGAIAREMGWESPRDDGAIQRVNTAYGAGLEALVDRPVRLGFAVQQASALLLFLEHARVVRDGELARAAEGDGNPAESDEGEA